MIDPGGTDDRGIDGEPGFSPYADVDQNGVARRIAPAYFNAGNVDVAADGTIRMWRPMLLDGHYDVNHVPVTTNAIERYSPDGVLEAKRKIGDGEAVFHPGGDVTLHRARADGTTEYVRLTAAFDEISRVVVPPSARVQIPDFYRIADDGSFTTEPGAMAVPRLASLIAAHDGGYYATQWVGNGPSAPAYRLLRLDANQEITATTWLLPGTEMPIQWQGDPIEVDGKLVTPILRYSFYDVQLLVDSQDRVWALSGAPSSATAALEHWLGRSVEPHGDPHDTGELFLMRFSPTLELETVVAVPAANPQMFPRIAEAADGAIGLTSLSIETRAIEPNKTFDYNVFFASVAPDGALLGQRELDIDHDEQPYALAACGTGFCIGGETGTSWVNTGSQVTFAQGFIMAVDTHANPTGLATLHGPRRSSIDTLAPRRDGGVVFAGTTDGPITHTDLGERERTPVLGSLRL